MSQTVTGEEKKKKLEKMIEKYKDQQGALMPILHEAQELYGYLSLETQQMIAQKLDIPISEVYGVATFYSQFKLKPKGQYEINVCLGTACYVKGAQAVLDRFCEELGIQVGDTTEDGKFSIGASRCVGACGLAPVCMINGEVYGRLVPEDVPKILEKYKD
ncbi:NADH-quinone oxidoreductase subunit NuoE [Garciella nitratireducens]|uniref:NAD(P)-dependent iron-only hydrogenase diaphorase component iron-sulfur protein n=1 Tax=Garciella nitratireducens DSM 15102 TaxID=1121911 RepID=A0A1T4L0U9_9FIRM|nr:NADH-quinone oxidoreductase subunit NuoE [Garciella nitratireducens]RBP36416.1 NAD(P)-dependent iron-only hydrogenase diaphorase component iron-sulfur protein [Garciella nitratireducens]SJZ48273.1 NAD(P)-dependent iron-only hydrogenase diaphorase component iron-sulfur protein [Garciella nitratireducens DSM 15102]